MSTMENIKKAVEIFRKYDCPFELMHCISAYPFEDNKANLNLISVLKQTFKCDVGYSGHEKEEWQYHVQLLHLVLPH